MTERTPHLAAIDLLRFLAAALVVAFHLTTVFPLADQSPLMLFAPTAGLPGDAARFTWFGWVGVEIFFVISGYVIANSAMHGDRRRFIVRRAQRLLPAMWIAAPLAALLLLAAGTTPPGTIVSRLISAMILAPQAAPLDPSYWTLSVEVVFYAIVALAPARVDRAALAIGVASALFVIVTALSGIGYYDEIDGFLLPLTLLPHGIFFALGAALSLQARRGGAATGAVAFAFVAIAAVEVARHATTMRDVPGIAADPIIPVAVFLLAVALIAGARRIDAVLARCGRRRIMWLGRLTYPLYLVHQTVAAAVIALLLAAGMNPAVATIAAAATSMALAALIARYGEPALAAVIERSFSRPRAPARDSLRIASPPTG